LRELGQHLSHLVAPLAAAHVDDDVGVTPLGQRVLGDGLAGTEAAGDRTRPTLGNGKEDVDDTLPGDQGFVHGEAFLDRPRSAHRPAVGQPQFDLLARSRSHAADDVGHRVLTLGGQFDQLSGHRGRYQHPMLGEFRLRTNTQHLTAAHLATGFQAGCEAPAAPRVQGRKFDPPADIGCSAGL